MGVLIAVMDIVIKYVTKNKKRVELCALFLLILVLLLVWLLIFIFSKPADPPGSVKILVCPKCSHKQATQIVDILVQKPKCEKDGAVLNQLQKCRTCGFEFPCPPANRDQDTQKYRNLMHLVESKSPPCPNCKSRNTFPVPPSAWASYDPRKSLSHKWAHPPCA